MSFSTQQPIVVQQIHRTAGINNLIELFQRVAAEEAWQPEGQLEAHTCNSTYFGVWVGEQLVGGLQLVQPDGAGKLPSHKVWPELAIDDPNSAMHIALLAVDKDWRGKAGGLFWLLTAQMWNYCVKRGIRHLWLEATPRTMRCYERLGWPLKVVGELREHWGEPCYPCYLSVREVAGALAERAVRSQSYQDILANMVGMQK